MKKSYTNAKRTQLVCPICSKSSVRIDTKYLWQNYNAVELVCKCGGRIIYYLKAVE